MPQVWPRARVNGTPSAAVGICAYERDQPKQPAQTNAVARLAEELRFQLAPMAASTVLEHYWMLKLLGDEPHATDTYAEGVRRGIPLPALPGTGVAAQPAAPAAGQKLAEKQ